MQSKSPVDWLNLARPALIGMVHLLPLPGTPRHHLGMEAIRDRALRDAELMLEAGFDALIVENMGDAPYLARNVGPEIVAAMTVVTTDIVALGVPVGVQVLAGANDAALSVATAAQASFIRAEGFVYSHVADEGWMDGDAGHLLRLRRSISSDVLVFCDVQKKHAAHSVTSDLTLDQWIEGAVFCGADGVVITGTTTGVPPSNDVLTTLNDPSCPVLIGSGLTPSNVGAFASKAHGLIVGSYIKLDGNWQNPVSKDRCEAIQNALSDALV